MTPSVPESAASAAARASGPEPRFRAAEAADAPAVAALHAASWRRHYRGAYADAFLDGDVVADRETVWAARLAGGRGEHGESGRLTYVCEADGAVVGFVHAVLDEHPRWGALVDNLHVAHGSQRRGIGARLMRLAAQGVAGAAPGSGLHLWVLEQNARAQSFYAALGGTRTERALVPPPGGDPSRLAGSPACLRYVWPAGAALFRG
ncbi:GNAT family N-acetyltransferase [Streptomyces sp. WMMC500]|uniref:GNAT family N-acetyltransferase n=1 Tax=Streptomyces sp. WMMC500 TaxID=3015154 RepID=UPI00248AD10C|nr:GNAT family N-acetyltransferase [Streptomyces sp. WMMC500]WBB61130.1 GNAT family N-acetyltransferase [Streptomyces sp. WMMC500]